MISFRHRITVALCLAASVGALGGCTQGAAGGATTAEAVQAKGDGPGRGHHRHGPPGGPEALFVTALHELDLSDAQKTTIQAAMDKARPKPPAEPGKIDAGRAEIGKALADGVRAGKIDEAAVKAKAGAHEKEMEAHRADLASAIATLHDTLTKDQRKALVDAVEKRMAEHGPGEGHHGRPGGPGGPGGPDGERGGPRGEHGPRGERGGPGGHEGHGPGPMRGGPLGPMLHDLDLTEAQREDIHKALEAQRPAPPDVDAMKKQHEAMRDAMKAKLAAFVEDKFDAAAFATPPEGDKGPGAFGPAQHVERMIKELSAVLPILQPAQREKLAALLEKGPPRGGPDGPMGPPHGGPDGRMGPPPGAPGPR